VSAVAVDAALICVAVFDQAQIRQVLTGDQNGPGLLSALAPGSIIALHSTVSPSVICEMAELASRHQVTVLDVAMTGGGPAAADAGELTFIVGGPADAVERVRPAFEAMARNIFHVGSLGSGVRAKILSNYLSISNLLLVREALRIAAALGFDEEEILEVVNVGDVGSSWVSRNWDRLRQQEASPTTGKDGLVGIWTKDLKLAREVAGSGEANAPILECLLSEVASDVRGKGLTV
jgi:3-hydroxyisobutyrate dehydrogenase